MKTVVEETWRLHFRSVDWFRTPLTFVFSFWGRIRDPIGRELRR